MSYFTQMAGLAYHNFLSAATGIALAIAVIRGIARRESKTIGNFWVDLTRTMLWVLLPVCVIGRAVFRFAGDDAELAAIRRRRSWWTRRRCRSTGADGKTTTQVVAEQVIPQGPVASQEAIKMFGTNGGGFFNANSAHPFENPDAAHKFRADRFDFCDSLGPDLHAGTDDGIAEARLGGVGRDGGAVCWRACYLRTRPSRAGILLLRGMDQQASATQSGGNMEGKEVRFGIANSALFATVTTDASCGAVNGMHDSFTPLGGMIPMINMMFGEVVFGGVGSGLYGMIVFVILSVFIAGLMVGRTPEYLGKKIEAYDVKMAMLAVLVFPLVILASRRLRVVTPCSGHRRHYESRAARAVADFLCVHFRQPETTARRLRDSTRTSLWYNMTMAFDMLFGRFFMVIPMLAIAGSLAAKKIRAGIRRNVSGDYAAVCRCCWFPWF